MKFYLNNFTLALLLLLVTNIKSDNICVIIIMCWSWFLSFVPEKNLFVYHILKGVFLFKNNSLLFLHNTSEILNCLTFLWYLYDIYEIFVQYFWYIWITWYSWAWWPTSHKSGAWHTILCSRLQINILTEKPKLWIRF